MTPHGNKRPSAILFDLDGTLIDTIELILSSARYAFEGWHRGVPTDAEWVRGIGTPLVQQLRLYAEDDAELAMLLERYRQHQREHHDRLTRCYTDVPDVVEQLAKAGYRLAIVTSKATPIAHQSLAHVGLDAYFQTVVGYEDTTRHKPNPEPVLEALGRLGVPTDGAVFVGDSPHDIHAGRAAGVATVAALWGAFDRETLAAAEPDHLIECASDLPGVLDRAYWTVTGITPSTR
jgi:pyrophosphatase PpaX